jgi:hypothetical protein
MDEKGWMKKMEEWKRLLMRKNGEDQKKFILLWNLSHIFYEDNIENQD